MAPTQTSRRIVVAALATLLAFALAAAALAAGDAPLTASAPAHAALRCCYRYRGKTSQFLDKAQVTFQLNLVRRNPPGSGFNVGVTWFNKYSPAPCASFYAPASKLTAVVHIPKSETFTIPSAQVLPDAAPHVVKNFVAHLTPGKVTGSFIDNATLQGHQCSTGTVTFSATLSAP